VPRNIAVTLKTVNSGHVNVRDVTGDFSVHNVNGAIEMQDRRRFRRGQDGEWRREGRLPGKTRREKSDFSTINGNVELYFAKGLSGDFRFKTVQWPCL